MCMPAPVSSPSERSLTDEEVDGLSRNAREYVDRSGTYAGSPRLRPPADQEPDYLNTRG